MMKFVENCIYQVKTYYKKCIFQTLLWFGLFRPAKYRKFGLDLEKFPGNPADKRGRPPLKNDTKFCFATLGFFSV